jgi:hypothetical protein
MSGGGSIEKGPVEEDRTGEPPSEPLSEQVIEEEVPSSEDAPSDEVIGPEADEGDTEG